MREVKFINLTAHEVVIHNAAMGDAELVLPPIGVEARVDSKLVRLESLQDALTRTLVPVIRFEDSYIYNLPEPQEDVVLVVSAAVRQAAKHRSDLASPDVTSNKCEWNNGKVRAVPGLVVNKREQK